MSYGAERVGTACFRQRRNSFDNCTDFWFRWEVQSWGQRVWAVSASAIRLGCREIVDAVPGGEGGGAKGTMPAGWHIANRLASTKARTRGRDVRISLTGTGDPKLAHAELQGGALQPQAHGRAVRSAQHPLGLLEHRQDVLTFGLFQGVVVLAGRRDGPRRQVGERHLQNRPWRE